MGLDDQKQFKVPGKASVPEQVTFKESRVEDREIGILEGHEQDINMATFSYPNSLEIERGIAGFFSEGSRTIFWRVLENGIKIVVKVTDLNARPSYSVAREISINQRIKAVLKKRLNISVEEPIAFMRDNSSKREYLIVKFIKGEQLRQDNQLRKKIPLMRTYLRNLGVYPSDLRIDDFIIGENGELYLIDIDTWNVENF